MTCPRKPRSATPASRAPKKSHVPPLVKEHDRNSGITRDAARDRIAGDVAKSPRSHGKPARPTIAEEPTDPQLLPTKPP